MFLATHPFRSFRVLPHVLQVNIRLLVFSVLGAPPDILSVEKTDMHNSRHEGSEAQGVSHSEDRANQKRRVCLISLNVEGQVIVQDSRGVVYHAHVVEVLVGTQWQVPIELGTTVGHSVSTDQDEESAEDGVPDRERRELKRVVEETSNTTPVESSRNEAEAVVTTERLVDANVARGDPSRELSDIAQERRNAVRNPLPEEGTTSNDHEELVAAHGPAVSRVGGTTAVQSIHDRAGDESCGPDHSSGPDEEAAHNTSETETHDLGGHDEQNLEAPSPRLTVEDLLGDENGDGVADCCSGSGHHGDEGVLLLVERTGVERSAKDLDIRHELGPASAQRVGDELHDGTGNGDLGVVLIEKDVDRANNRAEKGTNGPGTDSVDIERRIISRFDLSCC